MVSMLKDITKILNQKHIENNNGLHDVTWNKVLSKVPDF